MKTEFPVHPVLHTLRLHLRAPEDKDAPMLQVLRSEARVNRYLDRPGQASHQEILQFLEKIRNGIAQQTSFYWVITWQETDELIGTICLWHIDPVQGSAEIGYELHPDYWGRGIMQEAVEVVLDFAFEQLGGKVITAVLDQENERSVNLLERNKFKRDTEYRWVSEQDAAGLAVYFRMR